MIDPTNKQDQDKILVDAWPVDDLCHAAEHAWKELPKYLRDEHEKGNILFALHPTRIEVKMPEKWKITDSREVKPLTRWMVGNLGSMVIKGIQGELYICDLDIFKATYDKVGYIS